jgi:hypothetical protein
MWRGFSTSPTAVERSNVAGHNPLPRDEPPLAHRPPCSREFGSLCSSVPAWRHAKVCSPTGRVRLHTGTAVPYGGSKQSDTKPQTRLSRLGASWKLPPPFLDHLVGLLLAGCPHLAKSLQGTLPARVVDGTGIRIRASCDCNRIAKVHVTLILFLYVNSFLKRPFVRAGAFSLIGLATRALFGVQYINIIYYTGHARHPPSGRSRKLAVVEVGQRWWLGEIMEAHPINCHMQYYQMLETAPTQATALYRSTPVPLIS